MKNSINLFLVLSLLFALACKKKKENPDENMNSSAVSTVAPKVDGYLDVYYEYKISKDSSKFNYSIIRSMFYKQAQDNDSLYYFPFDADVGNVTFNDSAFGKEMTGDFIKYYYYPKPPKEVEQIKNIRVWNISGNGSFKKMSLTDNTTLPEYFVSTLPDTLFKNADKLLN